MSSPLLALFARSMREDARSRLTYLARTGLVLVILLFLLSMSSTFGWGNAPGLRFFGTVIYLNFFFILLAGLSYFASAITEEKEEMTLGLLRMTNLDPLSILLGKSTSRLVGALLLLAAQFPFTLLAIALGGVAVRQILAAYCTLGAFLVFLANLALLASVICRRTTAAAAITALTLLGFFAIVPWLNWLLRFPLQMGLLQSPGPLLEGLGSVAEFIALASPLTRLNAILRTGFADTPVGVQVWSNLGLGAACFVLAWLAFELFCGEQREAAPGRSVTRRRGPIALGAPSRAWSRALAWKDFYFLAGGKVWMAVKLILYALPLAAVALVPRYWGHTTSVKELGYFMLWLMLLIALAELAFMAASVFRQERKWMTLSSLAMLPMSIRRVAYQKILGCLPALLPAALYFALGIVCVSEDIASGVRNISPTPRSNFDKDALIALIGISYAVAQGVLFLHLTAWLSLYLKRGALPLAIAIHFIVHMFLGIIMAAVVRDSSALVVLTVFCVIGIGILHLKIGERLETLAAEE